jgi:hypothetical protein
MKRIDRKSGAIKAIERNATGDLCGGPLNGECDPVNGIATIPWESGCVAAAIGLVHFEPRGRIVKVCGDKVELMFERPIGDSGHSSDAMFGLMRTGNALVAAGIENLYRLDASGKTETLPMPKFKKAGEFHISYDMPGAILVITDINARHAVGGGAPIMVPR